MIVRMEMSTKPGIEDSRGNALKRRIEHEFHVSPSSVRVVDVYTIDSELSRSQIEMVKNNILWEPVSTRISLTPLLVEEDHDVYIEVAWKPGVTDNAARVLREAIGDLGISLGPKDNVYSSTQYRIKWAVVNGISAGIEADALTREILANPLVQRWNILEREKWLCEGMPRNLPRLQIETSPRVRFFDLDVGKEELLDLSRSGEWGLNYEELCAIGDYFASASVMDQRKKVGLPNKPTDVEMESLAQTWSEHCMHKQFNALIDYHGPSDERYLIEGLFETYIKGATREIMKEKNWVRSVFWDNAGVVDFDEENLICLKCETHNSPSNMEGYGGALTGIVGVYRDPMGTGMGAKLIFSYYGFVVGPQDYNGELRPPQHPRVLLERVRKGVEDGGNKHGVPTPYGRVFFDKSYLGKCVILVAAGGLIPSEVNGRPGWDKSIEPGDIILMAGGRVGVDGIHGATASSRGFDESTPAGHVQIGDPYMQKKLQDMLLEARDRGLYRFVQDNGAGGLNSSVGECAGFCTGPGGCVLHLDKVPLKYPNLDPWEILLSESQERMTFAVEPESVAEFMELSKKHDVEVTTLGEFTGTGKYHVKYNGESIVYLDIEFLHNGAPRLELNARWDPELIVEKVIGPIPLPQHFGNTLKQLLSRPNICSKEYIARQFDHEVQGGSVIKPLVGVNSSGESDAVVLRPRLDSMRGIAVSSGLNPHYSKFDTYHMSGNAIDEAIRRIVAVGGSVDRIALNDNFNWPSPLEDEHKMAQLVRANQALYDITIAFGTPCISGKDSMSIDGTIRDDVGNVELISGLPLVHYLAIGIIMDTTKCITMDVKMAGDLVYVVGNTRDEMGASEYCLMKEWEGGEVPKVHPESAKQLYRQIHSAVQQGIVSSIHGCYNGGLGVSLAQSAFAGGLGMKVHLSKVPLDSIGRDGGADMKILFSESPGRFVISVAPMHKDRFEESMKGIAYGLVGEVTSTTQLFITGIDGRTILKEGLDDLEIAWREPMRW